MRKLIAGLKVSLDGKTEGADGTADWVETWSEEYGLTDRIDACLLGGGMYPGYERYWSAIQADPDTPVWITGAAPSQAELAWARFITRTPHYVLSRTLDSTAWPTTRFLRDFDAVASLKQQPGRDIYLVGGASVTAALMDAGLVDEIRLLAYPLIAGEGRSLFATTARRQGLALQDLRRLPDGRVSMTYAMA
ncbi:dihydrofolate reductase family protein [Roseomonas sp. HJA6]|uniref:Dihydrofolate reductase family protein n=1 Tax=Roseomonas alba TaxID=2846776 RepID=A0ABS7A3L0_9PROT|nr:dihydrofolate reductase family protein [Neoroseomonas alba]MBW6396675.1 dihydrofolate reductase family protein [Neoroseomonas alba]